MPSFRSSPPPQPDGVRDYRLLLERWLKVCGVEESLALGIYGEAGGYPLAVVETTLPDPAKPAFYFSAGIHGDEPAPVEALIRWAEQNQGCLAAWNLTIFPCLNPWGLERNIRFDAEGRDLNRCYNSIKVPQIAAQVAVMKGRRFDVAASLHEDYDARGFYLYEIAGRHSSWGAAVRQRLSRLMKPDDRKSIDGHRANSGTIRRRIHPRIMPGHPEAFLLHFRHASRTLTFETPSELALGDRVRVQSAFLEIIPKFLKSKGGKRTKTR